MTRNHSNRVMAAHPGHAQTASPLSESKHENSERLSRQQAAERLTDVAYALMTGDPLRLGPDRQVTVPIADEVVLRRESRSNGGRVQLELELSWSTAKAQDC
jgi:amphi-Trp domain-containing protein